MVLKTSKDLLHISDADSTTGGRLETVTTRKLNVDAVLVSFPLLVGE